MGKHELVKFFLEHGCTQNELTRHWETNDECAFFVAPNGKVFGLHTFAFTWGIVFDCARTEYKVRYCYENRYDAIHEMKQWFLDGFKGEPYNYKKKKGIYVDEWGANYQQNKDNDSADNQDRPMLVLEAHEMKLYEKDTIYNALNDALKYVSVHSDQLEDFGKDHNEAIRLLAKNIRASFGYFYNHEEPQKIDNMVYQNFLRAVAIGIEQGRENPESTVTELYSDEKGLH